MRLVRPRRHAGWAMALATLTLSSASAAQPEESEVAPLRRPLLIPSAGAAPHVWKEPRPSHLPGQMHLLDEPPPLPRPRVGPLGQIGGTAPTATAIAGGVLFGLGMAAMVPPFSLTVSAGALYLSSAPFIVLASVFYPVWLWYLVMGAVLVLPGVPVLGPLLVAGFGSHRFGADPRFEGSPVPMLGERGWYLAVAGVQTAGLVLLAVAQQLANAERHALAKAALKPIIVPMGPMGTPGATLAVGF